MVLEQLSQAKDGRQPAASLIAAGCQRLNISTNTARGYLNIMLYMDGNPFIKVGRDIIMTRTPEATPPRYNRDKTPKELLEQPIPQAIIKPRQPRTIPKITNWC